MLILIIKTEVVTWSFPVNFGESLKTPLVQKPKSDCIYNNMSKQNRVVHIQLTFVFKYGFE